MIKEVSEITKHRPHFYKCNIASKEEVEKVWSEIVRKHGAVHILINNAARATGKSLDAMNIDQFKLTMDINFNSYVHFTMLFTKQKDIKDRK